MGRRGWGRGQEGPERRLRSPSRSWARAAAVPAAAAAAAAAAAGEDGGAGGRSAWSGALFPGLAPALSLAPPAPAGPRTRRPSCQARYQRQGGAGDGGARR